MKWIDALKQWNAKRPDGVWGIPKKGTKEYDEVRAIMGGSPAKAAPKASKAKAPKAKASHYLFEEEEEEF